MSRRDQWRAMADAGIIRLARRFPRCFDPRKPRPLMIGINGHLVPAIAGEMTPREVGDALRRYTSAIEYQRSLLAGAARIDLQGLPAGMVTPAEEAAAWENRRRYVAKVEARKREAAKAKAKAEAENAARRRPRVFRTLEDAIQAIHSKSSSKHG
jgi:ProP effector